MNDTVGARTLGVSLNAPVATCVKLNLSGKVSSCSQI